MSMKPLPWTHEEQVAYQDQIKAQRIKLEQTRQTVRGIIKLTKSKLAKCEKRIATLEAEAPSALRDVRLRVAQMRRLLLKNNIETGEQVMSAEPGNPVPPAVLRERVARSAVLYSHSRFLKIEIMVNEYRPIASAIMAALNPDATAEAPAATEAAPPAARATGPGVRPGLPPRPGAPGPGARPGGTGPLAARAAGTQAAGPAPAGGVGLRRPLQSPLAARANAPTGPMAQAAAARAAGGTGPLAQRAIAAANQRTGTGNLGGRSAGASGANPQDELNSKLLAAAKNPQIATLLQQILASYQDLDNSLQPLRGETVGEIAATGPAVDTLLNKIYGKIYYINRFTTQTGDLGPLVAFEPPKVDDAAWKAQIDAANAEADAAGPAAPVGADAASNISLASRLKSLFKT